MFVFDGTFADDRIDAVVESTREALCAYCMIRTSNFNLGATENVALGLQSLFGHPNPARIHVTTYSAEAESLAVVVTDDGFDLWAKDGVLPNHEGKYGFHSAVVDIYREFLDGWSPTRWPNSPSTVDVYYADGSHIHYAK